MMLMAMLLWAAQASAAAPPPVAVERMEPQLIGAVSWSCELSSTDHQALKLTGAFPSISVESQKNGGAFHLQTNVQSKGNYGLTGAFPAAMTGSMLGMDHYSIMVPNTGSQIPAYIFTFELFERSKGGFVNVAQFDSTSGAPTAYVSGLCVTQVTK